MQVLEGLQAADEALAPAFEIQGAADAPATPLIFASPHSGRLYPKSMMAASSLGAEAIRRSEDVLVDDLRQKAADPTVAINWFDAAVLTARVRNPAADTSPVDVGD